MTYKNSIIALDCNGVELRKGMAVRDIKTGEISEVSIILDSNMINIRNDNMQYIRFGVDPAEYERVIPTDPTEFKDWISV